MRPVASVAPVLVLRLALLAAILASATLVVDYANVGDPAFCGVGSGCMAVRRSAYSCLGGVPLPIIGLLAEAGLLFLSLFARDRAASLVVTLAAGAGGFAALGLIALQKFVIGAFCKWCVVVDTSTVLAAVAAVLLHRQVRASADPEAVLAAGSSRAFVAAWVLGAGAVAALPFVWGEYPVVAPLPPAVAALAKPGKLTLVTFTDFECPFCRRLAPTLHDVVAQHPEKVELVRVMAPLASHPGAMPAALAWECAPAAQREDMATRLYEAPEEELTTDGVKKVASEMKLDEAAFAQCLAGAEARDAVARDKALFEALDLAGLPFTYIGARTVIGANADGVRRMVDFGISGPRPSLPVAWMLAAAAAVAALLAGLTVGASRGAVSPAAPT
jgi:protein-disulfide isomerase